MDMHVVDLSIIYDSNSLFPCKKVWIFIKKKVWIFFSSVKYKVLGPVKLVHVKSDFPGLAAEQWSKPLLISLLMYLSVYCSFSVADFGIYIKLSQIMELFLWHGSQETPEPSAARKSCNYFALQHQSVTTDGLYISLASYLFVNLAQNMMVGVEIRGVTWS